jgi:hypothetical protein
MGLLLISALTHEVPFRPRYRRLQVVPLSGGGGIVLKVTVPGRDKPVFVSIGLVGNGMVARTILDSLRAA